MKARRIKLSIETATRWYNGTDNELKELAVQTFPELKEKQLPKSWKELGDVSGFYVDDSSNIDEQQVKIPCVNYHRNLFATKEQAEASIALAQLSQLMKVYNDGWVADWSDNENKYCIEFIENRMHIYIYLGTKKFLSFSTRELAEQFMHNFSDLIQQAKPLL